MYAQLSREELEDLLLVPVVRHAPGVAAARVLNVQLAVVLGDELLAQLEFALPGGHHQRGEAAARLEVDVALARGEDLLGRLRTQQRRRG